MDKKTVTESLAIGLCLVAIGGQAWGWGNINTKFDFSKTDRRTYDSSNRSNTKVGGNMSANSHNRTNSHNLGSNSILIEGGYQPRLGHGKVNIGDISGSNNYVDNSISGNFGIGHTTLKGE